MCEKYNKAKKEKVLFKVGDNVGALLRRKMFEKGSVANWSKTVHKIVDKLIHSYTLDNGKVFKYYQLMRVATTENPKIINTREKSKIQTFEQLTRDNRIKRNLVKQGIDLSNIIPERQLRKRTDRFTAWTNTEGRRERINHYITVCGLYNGLNPRRRQ